MPGFPLCLRPRAASVLAKAAVLFAVIALGAPAAGPTSANPQDFASWLSDFRREALSAGISQRTLDEALENVQPIERIIELDRKQPEFVLTFREYLARQVTDARVEKAKRLYEQHRALLDEIGRKYGVPPRFIVALWGMETDFGRVTGKYSVVAALATLAYDGRRAAFFRGELINALRIIDQGHIRAADMIGSWAGAMGQNQFMPSSFLSYAVDYDGDGRRDIWASLPDVLASIANYLGKSGWKPEQGWGRAARLPEGFDMAQADLSVKKPLGEWSALGVRLADGSAPPEAGLEASIVRPAGGEDAFFAYDNYRVIMKWNRALSFATAVGILADRIGGGN